MASHERECPPLLRQLSHAERLIWQVEQGTASLPFLECPRHLALAVRVTGRLDAGALQRTLADIVRRHDALRARYPEQEGRVSCLPSDDFEPSLIVTAVGEPVSEPANAPFGDGPHALEQRLLHEEVNAPFRLRDGGLLRARIFTFTPSHSLLVVTLHHIAGDGWSLRLLARELRTGYGGHVLGQQPSWPVLPAGYADYVEWQQDRLRSSRAHELAATWADEMTGVPAAMIPGDLAPHGTVTRAARHRFAIAPHIVERLRAIAAAHRTTIGVAALASFIRLVAHAGRRSTVVIGVPVWDRSRPAFEEMIGLCMNALPIRVEVPAHATLPDMVAETRERLRHLSRVSSLPYPWLRDWQMEHRDAAADPFRIVFNFAAIDGIGIDLPGVVSEPLDVLADTPAVADISLHIFARGASFVGVFLYKEQMYSRELVASLASQYIQLLAE